ncbi:hypothetical protein EAG_14835 [Camponotus floridanus]|uniref:Uncharacterized protein n=1 Tax=Camponotus floridanus TaxID=104421 RepID=E2ABR9_CAMFO|nr:hypothetical protein EAG_14835 [Camponotus floridanus]
MEEIMNGWRDEVKKTMEGVMEVIKEQGRGLREEMEGMRRDMKEQVMRWKEERMEIMKIIKRLEKKVKELETEEKGGKGVKRGQGRIREEKKINERVKDIERKMELKERADRKRNIIIRGLEVKGGRRREAVEEIFERIEVRAEIEEVKRLGGNKDKERELVWEKGENFRGLDVEEEKNEVKVGGDSEGGNEKRKKGMGYGVIRIDEQWWRWDEIEEVLVDGRGKIWDKEMEEVKGESREERR